MHKDIPSQFIKESASRMRHLYIIKYIIKQQYHHILPLSDHHIPHFTLIRTLTYHNCELLQSITNSIVKTADFYFDLVNNHQNLLIGIPNCVKIIQVKFSWDALEIVEYFWALSNCYIIYRRLSTKEVAYD